MQLKTMTLRSVAILIFVGVFAGLVRGDETEAFIKDIIKGVRTDSERSAKLMEAVSMTGSNDKLQIALLEKTVEYGMRGLRTEKDCSRVLEATGILIRMAPEKTSTWLSQQAKVYRRKYSLTKSKEEKHELACKIVSLHIQAGHSAAVKGDWKASMIAYGEAKTTATLYRQLVRYNLKDRVRAISNLSKAVDQVVKYKETLTLKPGDAEAREKIIKTLLVTLDKPADAAKYVNEDADPKYQAYVPLAGKNISDVPFVGCKSLGEWYYKELAKSVVPLDKLRMLKRAKVYQQRALSLYDKSDIASAAMKHQISQIEGELVKLAASDPLACVYCLTSHKTGCPTCIVKGKSTGKLQCLKCKNTGKMKCGNCGGKYGVRCKKCNGRGYSTYTSYYGYSYRNSCYQCDSTGKMHWSTRYKRYQGSPCSYCSSSSPKGSTACATCSGGAGKSDCATCSGTKKLPCTHCN